MKNKKGMLLTEETLKIIIAVIGLVLLSYLLISLFTSNSREKKQRDAAATIERISLVIDNLKVSGGEDIDLHPKGWTLFGFVGEEEKPNSCIGENCLCICNKVVGGEILNRQTKQCDKRGSCLSVSNLNDFEDVKIKSYKEFLTKINLKEEGGKISITEQ